MDPFSCVLLPITHINYGAAFLNLSISRLLRSPATLPPERKKKKKEKHGNNFFLSIGRLASSTYCHYFVIFNNIDIKQLKHESINNNP